MSSRIVLFGASGYTGELTAREMVARGMTPVLAGRRRQPLERLAAELGGLELAVADVEQPASVRALVGKGDVLVSTVGPFMRFGQPALDAALSAGAHYLDSTGEGPFIRRVFEQAGPRARAEGTVLLTAMGYDYVPGNLAGALALREAGDAADRVEIGYCWQNEGGGSASGMSGGTRASAAGVAFEPSFAWRGGRLVTERGAKEIRSFDTGAGHSAEGVSIGGSEHFALPHIDPRLQDVGVYLAWFGSLTKPMQIFSAGGAAVTKIPGVRAGLGALSSKFVTGSTGGPDAAARAGSRSIVCAVTYDRSGKQLSSVRLKGPNGYDLTAAFLAWGAEQVAAGKVSGSGALGPVEAFGLDELTAAAASYGLKAD